MAIRTSGSGDSILLEDARDLGEWAATPPAVMGDGKIQFLAPVPSLPRWLASAEPDPDQGDGGLAGAFGVMGGILGIGG